MAKIRNLVFILLYLFTSTNSHSQELAKNVIYAFDDFSKGLNTTDSSINLPKQYGIVCDNLRFNTETRTLVKRDQLFTYGTADTTEAITGMHRLYLKDGTKRLIVVHGDEIEVGADATGVFTTMLALSTGDRRWLWVTWHDLAIGCDGYNQPVKTDGTNATYLGSCHAADNGAGAGPNGTYTYKISYYTASYEVLFNQVSNSVTVVDNDIDLIMIPIAPDTYGGENVTGRRVYRNTVAAPATWNLLSNGDIANNTATTLTDSDADAAVGVAYPAGDATYTPPKGRIPVIHKNRLWFANDPTTATDTGPSTIYYCEDGLENVFITNSYFNVRRNDGDEITFAKNLLGRLTIGKTNTIQKIFTDGDTPSSDWSISDPFSFVGSPSIYGVDNSPLGIIYPARDGLYIFNGQYSKLISEKVTSVIKDISPSNFVNIWGQYHQNMFYLAYASKESGSGTNNRVLAYSLLYDAYAIDILSINAFCAFNSGTDWGILYAGSSTNGDVYSYGTVSYEITHKKHSEFSGTFDDARYIPQAAGGDSNDPILELSWDLTIDGMAGTINAASGDINRPDTGGTYISQVLNTTNASAYDKLYWNETFPTETTADVTFAIRSGATDAACQAAGWSATEYTNPAGSDISGVTANDFTQYRITLSTGNIDYTPVLTKETNYVVKLTYDTLGTASETSISIEYQTGWTDLGYPGFVKSLKQIYVIYEGTTGTLSLEFENFEGDTDTFNISLDTYPKRYTEYFTNGKFMGEWFRLNITENSLNSIKIKKVYLIFDVEYMVLQ